jgi:hypothetical protein
MLDAELLSSVAKQMMEGEAVEVNGKRIRVRRFAGLVPIRFSTVAFAIDGREYQAIEQNPEKPSRWGQLARKGHQVVQFKGAELNKFVAVAVDGKVKLDGAE